MCVLDPESSLAQLMIPPASGSLKTQQDAVPFLFMTLPASSNIKGLVFTFMLGLDLWKAPHKKSNEQIEWLSKVVSINHMREDCGVSVVETDTRSYYVLTEHDAGAFNVSGALGHPTKNLY
jgi:hypothetical protein